MSDFLSIDGNVYYVVEGGAEELEPEIVGESKRAIDGTLRSNEQDYKSNFRFTLEPMAQADYNTLKTTCRAGDWLVCGGDALGVDADVAYQVRITGAGYTVDDMSYRVGVQVTLRRV
jgi:hypothetical protein